jgi:hypothetical protein
LDRDVAECSVQRARFGMSEDKQNFHGSNNPWGGSDRHQQLDNVGMFHYIRGIDIIVPRNG